MRNSFRKTDARWIAVATTVPVLTLVAVAAIAAFGTTVLMIGNGVSVQQAFADKPNSCGESEEVDLAREDSNQGGSKSNGVGERVSRFATTDQHIGPNVADAARLC